MIFSATLRRTGCCCSATNTRPMPPSPICSISLYGPITVPGVRRSARNPRSRRVGKEDARESRRRSRGRSSDSTSAAAADRPHARSRYAARCSGGSFTAALKMPSSDMVFSLVGWSAHIQCENGAAKPPVKFLARRIFLSSRSHCRRARPGRRSNPLGGRRGDAKDLGRLGHRATEKIAQLDQLGLAGLLRPRADPGPRERPDFERVGDLATGKSSRSASGARGRRRVCGSACGGRFDQNSPHGLGRRGEEMAATVPVLLRPLADQPR